MDTTENPDQTNTAFDPIDDIAQSSSPTNIETDLSQIYNAYTDEAHHENQSINSVSDQNQDVEPVQLDQKDALPLESDPPERSIAEMDRTVLALQNELKKTWKLLEDTNAREVTNKQTIQDLEIKVSDLALQLSNSDTIDQTEVLKIMHQRDALRAELDEQNRIVEHAQEELRHRRSCDDQAKSERDELLHELNELKHLVAIKQSESESQAQALETCDQELRQTRAVADQRSDELKGKTDQLSRAQEDVRQLEQQLKETKEIKDKLAHESDTLHDLKRKLEEEVDHHIYTATHYSDENKKLMQEIRLAEDDAGHTHSELKTIAKMREILQRKLKHVDEAKTNAEQERDSHKSMLYSLERQIESHVKQAESDRKQIEDLVRERDILSKNCLKATSATQKQVNIVKIHEQAQQNLEQEVSGFKEEAAKQRKLILALEKERDRYVNEVAQISATQATTEENVIIKENQIFDYKKKLGEAEHKLKQQQALYEQVRSDRNLYSKNLIESQGEITEMRRKYKITTHQIEQYKEEIAAKESELLKEHLERQRTDKERDAAKQEVQKLKLQLDASQQFIHNQEAEENNLRHIINESDADRLHQKKECETVIQERDILGTQLIRRNDEIALLYEKIKIQQSTLNKGEIQYRERVEDIRVLKLEVKKLRREKAILQHETTNVDSLRSQVYRFQKEILNERTRVKVLEEELQTPLNMHRWRKLAGSDPSTFELVQKVQTLQRRLISKTEQVVEKELIIHAKEKLYNDLKTMLSRVPGPEVVHQLETLKSLAKDKTRESKALASELNMLQSEALDFRAQCLELNQQTQDWKKKYLLVKRVLQKRQMIPVPTSDKTSLIPKFVPKSDPTFESFGSIKKHPSTGLIGGMTRQDDTQVSTFLPVPKLLKNSAQLSST